MPDERRLVNMKYRVLSAWTSIAVYAAVYILPGALVARGLAEWAGLLWMVLGAIPYLVFSWLCYFPEALVLDRDGMRIEGRWGKRIDLHFDRIHEARWVGESSLSRRIFGPLVFAEPVWFLQLKSRRKLLLVHGGVPVTLREDEYGDLSELAAILAKQRVPGIPLETRRPTWPGADSTN